MNQEVTYQEFNHFTNMLGYDIEDIFNLEFGDTPLMDMIDK